MPVVINPESELGRELAKFEQHYTKFVGDGQSPGNPYTFRPFPAMVYKAAKKDNGKVVCMEAPPDITGFTDANIYERACLAVDSLNRRCARIVKDDAELRQAKADGWRENPGEAIAFFEGLEQDIARAAAEAAYAAQRMTAKAQEELRQAEESTSDHVTDVKGVKGGPRYVGGLKS